MAAVLLHSTTTTSPAACSPSPARHGIYFQKARKIYYWGVKFFKIHGDQFAFIGPKSMREYDFLLLMERLCSQVEEEELDVLGALRKLKKIIS